MSLELVEAVDLHALVAVSTFLQAVAGDDRLGLNWLMRLLIDLSPLRMSLPTLLALYVWLRPGSGYRDAPVPALRGAVGVALALAIGRAAQELLPARSRPYVALPDFPFPPLGYLYDLSDWSSMPSDSAALAFALVAVVWAASWRLGLVAAVWSVLAVCLPRLVFGYHSLSDLVAGALLGTVAVVFALHLPLPGGPPGGWTSGSVGWTPGLRSSCCLDSSRLASSA